MADGTVAHFNKTYVGTYPYGNVTGIVTDIARPSGETLTFNYESAAYCAASKPGGAGDICTRHSTTYRISSVTNNSSYRLYFNYVGDGTMFDPDTVPDTGTWQQWGDMTGVSMTNSAIAGASTRTQNFGSIYSGGNSYFTITDPIAARRNIV